MRKLAELSENPGALALLTVAGIKLQSRASHCATDTMRRHRFQTL